MLDIGAGNSLLGYFFKEHGWHSTILEPNTDACAYQEQYGVKVIPGMLNTCSFDDSDNYDFINLQYVLEHTYDPVDILSTVRQLMHGDTILRIQVPNDFSPGHQAWLEFSQKEPAWISYPDHINYFNFGSLSRLLSQQGFVEISRDTTFPLELLLLTGNDYYNQHNPDINVARILSEFEQSWKSSKQEHVLADFYRALANTGMGRSVIMYLKVD